MNTVYHDFVVARHQIWEKRQLGLPAPWATDPLLNTRKFTNVFRVLDAGTQFVIRELFPDTTYQTALMRAFLYRYTNRPEPWVAFHKEFGTYPVAQDLEDDVVLDFWTEYREAGHPIFGMAYKMFSGNENKGTDRLTWAVNLARDYFSNDEFTDTFQNAGSQTERATLLQTIPRCAGFMSMQILTDIGYSEHLQANENEFVIAGPGARIGAKHIEPGRKAESLIRELTYDWAENEEVTLYGRTPSLMDVQNTLCEFGKYMKYKPGATGYKGHGDTPEPILPSHWRLTK